MPYKDTLSGKKSKSVFDFLTYSRETGFSFSYEEVEGLDRPIGAFNEIDSVSKFDNSLSLVPSRMLYGKYFLRYEFLKIYLQKIQIDFFS